MNALQMACLAHWPPSAFAQFALFTTTMGRLTHCIRLRAAPLFQLNLSREKEKNIGERKMAVRKVGARRARGNFARPFFARQCFFLSRATD